MNMLLYVIISINFFTHSYSGDMQFIVWSVLVLPESSTACDSCMVYFFLFFFFVNINATSKQILSINFYHMYNNHYFTVDGHLVTLFMIYKQN